MELTSFLPPFLPHYLSLKLSSFLPSLGWSVRNTEQPRPLRRTYTRTHTIDLFAIFENKHFTKHLSNPPKTASQSLTSFFTAASTRIVFVPLSMIMTLLIVTFSSLVSASFEQSFEQHLLHIFNFYYAQGSTKILCKTLFKTGWDWDARNCFNNLYNTFNTLVLTILSLKTPWHPRSQGVSTLCLNMLTFFMLSVMPLKADPYPPNPLGIL